MGADGGINVTVTGCTFIGHPEFTDPYVDIDHGAVPPGTFVTIKDETFTRPMSREAFRRAIGGRTGHVRIGPCPYCGLAAPYVDGSPFHEDVVECVMTA